MKCCGCFIPVKVLCYSFYVLLNILFAVSEIIDDHSPLVFFGGKDYRHKPVKTTMPVKT